MIDEIRVENLALIREASVVVGDGLTVLTGETGAGKTALLFGFEAVDGGARRCFGGSRGCRRLARGGPSVSRPR